MADLAEVRHGDDHGTCAHAAERRGHAPEALARAEALCAARGHRLTPIRREVLEALLATHRPLGAYDLVDRLAGARPAQRRMAPITVYRALDFLMEEGLVHRLASRNAFIPCPHPHSGHAHGESDDPDHAHGGREAVAFLICDACGGVDEMASSGLTLALQGLLAAEGFAPRTQMLEIAGLCAHCQHSDPAPRT